MTRYSKPFLLTTTGSTRATAYGFSNKSITIDNKTHVVWLDAVASVKGRTYDHGTEQWSEVFDLFEGCDNHTSPALALDKDGHIRMAYGPHGVWGGWNHGMFKWVISERPGSIDKWTREQSFGYHATYAGMCHTTAGIDAIVYRGGDAPPSLMFQKQRHKGGWTQAKCLLQQDIAPQYTHYGGMLTCAADGTLYTACHFYNVGGGDNHPVKGNRSRMGSIGAAALKSIDMGETWTDLANAPFNTPGLYDERIAVPPFNEYVYIEGLVVDSRGTLWVLTLKPAMDDERILLSCWTSGGWRTVDLQSCLPLDRIAIDAVMTVDTKDRLHLALTAALKGEPSDVNAWGHPSCEVFHLVTRGDIKSTECNMISSRDNTTANWLPNISLSGPTQPVDRPVIVYTHGQPGEGCSPCTTTEAYCVFVDAS